MTKQNEFENQFHVETEYYLKQLDFLNWYRYYFIIKEVLSMSLPRVLEVGTGSGIVKNCLAPHVKSYTSFDINAKLKPDVLGDIRIYESSMENNFDCVIVADVLEHIPFDDLGSALKNMNTYLAENGKAIVTIPHRRSHFLLMTPTYKPHVLTVPTGFLSVGSFYRRFIKRKIWIDPDHCWEIGDGKIKRKDVEKVFYQSDFVVERFQKLMYVDFWALRKY